MTKYAHKQDANCKEIVDALRKVPGVMVKPQGNATIDLLVGYRGANYLFEVKKPSGLSKRTGQPLKNDFTDAQIKFIREWTGQVNIIRDLNDALLVLGVLSGEKL